MSFSFCMPQLSTICGLCCSLHSRPLWERWEKWFLKNDSARCVSGQHIYPTTCSSPFTMQVLHIACCLIRSDDNQTCLGGASNSITVLYKGILCRSFQNLFSIFSFFKFFHVCATLFLFNFSHGRWFVYMSPTRIVFADFTESLAFLGEQFL